MDHTVTTYALYLAISTGITIWVARKLFKNGRIFLVDIFKGNEPLADSVNALLLVGFYLVNIGYMVYTLKMTSSVGDVRELIEVLSIKVGRIILILGAMHFMNLFIFFNLRKSAKTRPVEVAPLPNKPQT